MPLNVAQVGVGRWGMNILRTIREEVPGLKLHRLVSRNSALDKQVSQDCHIHEDWRDLLQCGDIEAVFLAVPSAFHLEMTTAFVEAGIPVFVEKPMTLCVEDGQKLLETAAKYNAIVRVNHIDLHNPAILRVKEEVAQSGALLSIKGRIGGAYERRSDISPLWEYSPHFVAVCIELNSGAPITVSAYRQPRETEPKDDPSKEIVAIEMVFSDGSLACIEVGNGMKVKSRILDFQYENARFRFDDQSYTRLMRESEDGQVMLPVSIQETLPLTLSIQNFEGCIRNGDVSLDSVRMGIEVVRVLEIASKEIGETLPNRIRNWNNK